MHGAYDELRREMRQSAEDRLARWQHDPRNMQFFALAAYQGLFFLSLVQPRTENDLGVVTNRRSATKKFVDALDDISVYSEAGTDENVPVSVEKVVLKSFPWIWYNELCQLVSGHHQHDSTPVS